MGLYVVYLGDSAFFVYGFRAGRFLDLLVPEVLAFSRTKTKHAVYTPK